MGGEKEKRVEKFKLQLSDNNSNQIKLLYGVEEEKPIFSGAVNVNDKQVSFIIGDSNDSALLVKGGEIPLIQSQKWKAVSRGLLPNPVTYWFMQPHKISEALKRSIMRLVALEETSEKEMAEINKIMFQEWDYIETVLASANLQGGMRTDQCFITRSESAYGKFYTELFSSRATTPPQRRFSNLINDRTVFSFSISGDYLLLLFKGIEQQYASVLGAAEDKKDENCRYDQECFC